MMNKMNSMIRSEKGQGMTEYIIIVALIAIAAIGVITIFGQNLRNLFSSSANALAGNDDVSNKGTEVSVGRKSLKNFGDNTNKTSGL